MWYLYLGYVLAHSYAVTMKIYHEKISLLATAFSIIVFLVCSLLPVAGYWLAKMLKYDNHIKASILLGCGILFGVVEILLFRFDILVYGQGLIANAIIFACSFMLACLPLQPRFQRQVM